MYIYIYVYVYISMSRGWLASFSLPSLSLSLFYPLATSSVASTTARYISLTCTCMDRMQHSVTCVCVCVQCDAGIREQRGRCARSDQ